VADRQHASGRNVWYGLCPDHLQREVERDGTIRWYPTDTVMS
jgi:hypothetical protein